MFQEEYILLFIDDQTSTVWVKKQGYAALSEEAKLAHEKFENLQKEFAKNGKYSGFRMFEIRINNSDKQNPFSCVEVQIPNHIRNGYNDVEPYINVDTSNRMGGK